ncbi:MAG TPA: DUF4433 domain-containing protein [Thermoanaerobaculia bacterium]|nr:DUF4433 domain-containing protein [Thermoanaerobaculia bacterium]
MVYLVTNCQAIQSAALRFVFSDGHGLAAYTEWFEDLRELARVDWSLVKERYWADDPTGDNDRQRRKQAEFLIHQFCPWEVIQGIVVIDQDVMGQVQGILDRFAVTLRKPVAVRPGWYY